MPHRSRCNDEDLRAIFSQFGMVQTCIVNQEKRHGFIKMISRRDAMSAKEGMEHFKRPDMQLRVCSTSASKLAPVPSIKRTLTHDTDTMGRWLWAS